ncbi:thiamine-phosphate kinase [Thermomonas flagellata]|uniref:thiamine-phosphate kinase n=1 Tax=Thermomonas flagellata TaxID=2888524 RepID=UPI001F04D401|nr:thiamine-phosphate kinase [Thermomonas flagellata]
MSEREFDLIARIRRRVAARADVVLGIGDDCALLAPPPGMLLAVTTDTLNAGVHFPADTAPTDLGWKALAVNLSDLAAMGAQPAWCTLALSLPQADAAWLDAFCDGFLALAQDYGMTLVGGDTTRGPLAITVTAHGCVPAGAALRRDGAGVGDEVWVSGTLGDAAAALAQWRAGHAMAPALRARLDRPMPRVALGLALRGVASSCIDISDGLLADLAHVCRASGVGAEIAADALPASPALQAAFAGDRRRVLQATGGDDYELCFTAPAAQREAVQALGARLGLPLARIGRIVAGSEVRCTGLDGFGPLAPGYQHFA